MTGIPARSGRSAVLHKRWLPFAAAATAAVLTAGAIATAGGGSAGAAAAPQAQSVGNFLDAALNGQPIDDLAKLQYASATSPGSQSVQNPLDVTALNAIHLPLTGALQLPKLAGADAGVVNQVAVAKSSGESYGASGAVLNSGGVSIGGDNNAEPTVATVDLCASALAGNSCGSNPADAIGALHLSLGAVAGLAKTPQGYGKAGSTDYAIAGVDLSLDSPLLGQVLKTLDSTLSGLVGQLTKTINGLTGLPTECQLTASLGKVSLENGAVTVDASTGSLTISLDKLLSVLLGKSLNQLPANTDLLKYLIDYLTDPNGLAKGIVGIVNGLTDPLAQQFLACNKALNIPVLSGVLNTLVNTLLNGQKTLEDAATSLVSGLVAGLGGANASTLLDPLVNLLKSVVDIGVNVQPNGPAGTFETGLDATPKQGTDIVAGQTIVRAIEVDLLSGGRITPAAARKAAARKASDPLLALALGNAAAGPSAAAPVASTPSTPAPGHSVPAANIPTGVPAGLAQTGGGTPALPIALLGLAVLFAAGGALSLTLRRRANTH
jgi:hypothetical protein